MVCFYIRDIIEDQMEGRWVYQDYIVNRDVRAADKAEQSSILTRRSDSLEVSLTVGCSEAVAGEDLDMLCILNDYGISTKWPVRSKGNETLDLDGIGRSFIQDNARCNCIGQYGAQDGYV